MINISINNDGKKILPLLNINGHVSLSIKEIALLVYMLSEGTYAFLLYEELSKTLTQSQLQNLLQILNNLEPSNFNLLKYLQNTNYRVLEEAKIPIVSSENQGFMPDENIS